MDSHSEYTQNERDVGNSHGIPSDVLVSPSSIRPNPNMRVKVAV